MDSLAARFVLGVLACLWVLGSACSPTSPRTHDPRTVRLSPDVTSRSLTLFNSTAHAQPLSDLHFEGADWEVFRIEGHATPRNIPAGGRTQLTIGVSAVALAEPTRGHRDARAILELTVDGEPRQIQTAFHGERLPRRFLAHLLLLLPMATVVALVAWPNLRHVHVGWLAALVVACTAVPFGDAICFDRLWVEVTAAEIEQCRDGLEGLRASAWPDGPTLGIAWAVAAGFSLHCRAGTGVGRVRSVRVIQWLTIGLALATGELVSSHLSPSGAAVDLAWTPDIGTAMTCAALLAAVAALAVLTRLAEDSPLNRAATLLGGLLVTATLLGGPNPVLLGPTAWATLLFAAALVAFRSTGRPSAGHGTPPVFLVPFMLIGGIAATSQAVWSAPHALELVCATVLLLGKASVLLWSGPKIATWLEAAVSPTIMAVAPLVCALAALCLGLLRA
ncbi:MAG: hypothetical protein V3V08_15575 [Nannocystaceae bacterium]